jgi:ethanolamine ammonia-lyase small subunit
MLFNRDRRLFNKDRRSKEEPVFEVTPTPMSAPARDALRSYTPARIGLETTGVSVATKPQLDFQLAHARARDAVQASIDVRMLCDELRRAGLTAIALKSQATDRATYLRRPDLGRKLSQDSAALLQPGEYDVVFVIADGLSALAVERHAMHLLQAVLPSIPGWRIAPVCVVEQGRVAISAPLCVVLIGERPGLSSPDSLGAYLTWDPRPGKKDAERNCISNIRDEGLGYAAAAGRLQYYLQESKRLKKSGLALKDPATDVSGLL